MDLVLLFNQFSRLQLKCCYSRCVSNLIWVVPAATGIRINGLSGVVCRLFLVDTLHFSQGGIMRFVKSIVILNSNGIETKVVDLVLIVKHPEGCDPVDRIHSAINDFLNSETGQKAQKLHSELTWRDLMNCMNGWDWSSQALYIEEVHFWSV